jgi:hypothetical protein
MAPTKPTDDIGPHVLVYYTDEGTNLHMNVTDLRADQIFYIAALLVRNANQMLDYQQAQAQKNKPRLVVPT